ncbi:MAG: LPS-assembly protein LptD, partial [Geminicoccaceae bacterium]
QYDSQRGVVSAQGNVVVIRGDRRLLADVLTYDEKADQIEAHGNVILLEPSGEAVFADQVTLSGDLGTGVIDQLRARLQGDALFAAVKARRTEGRRTELDRAVYSPCPLCADPSKPPLWQIAAERVTHDQESKTITYRNAFFELWGVPVLYTPYFSHPDPTVKRKSGFLAPSFGSDSALGLMVQTPYFFNLAPNYDLTLAPIFTTNQGPVLTGEYRHLLRSGRFDLAASGTYATAGNSGQASAGDEFRGHLQGEGRFRLQNRWRWGYDLFVTTDDTYLRRYDFSNENVLTNRLYSERIWDRNYAAINAYGFEGLRDFDDQGMIPLVFPLAELDWTSEPWRWGSRFNLDGSLLGLTRTDGLDTRRLSGGANWELPWAGPLGDQYRLRLGVHGDFYQLDGDPETFEDNGTSVESRLYPRATLEWSWPWIADGMPFTPIVEPVVSATWTLEDLDDQNIPNEDSQDLEFDDTSLFEPSRYPGLDRVEDGSRLNYGLRFSAFGDSGGVLSGLFGQSYALQQDSGLDPSTGLDGNFSDYVGRLDLSPDRWLNLRYRFRLDRDSLSLLRNEVTAVAGPPRVRFDVSYLSLQDDPEEELFRQRKEINAGVTLGISRSLAVRAQTRRNLELNEPISYKFGFIYRHPCLQLIGGFERRFTENEDTEGSTTFTIRVTFRNLGERSSETGVPGSSL